MKVIKKKNSVEEISESFI